MRKNNLKFFGKGTPMEQERQSWVRIVMFGLLVFTSQNVPALVQAESELSQDPLVQHLEFLGYECDRVEAGIRAKHFSKIHLYITYAFGGIRLQTGFPGNPIYSDVGSRFKVTNTLQKKMSVMQVFWSDEGNLFAMGWMPGTYDKARFAVFMESWERDSAVLRKAYTDLKPFLKETSPSLSSS